MCAVVHVLSPFRSQPRLYDLNANGLSGSHEVGLWTGSGTLLTTATVPAGTGATLADSFRYVMISPLILNPGSYVVGALNQATDTYVGLATGFVADPRISFTTGRFTFSPALVFPNGLDNMSPSIFGPNLRIDAPTAAVPEPASLSLLGAGLFGLAAGRRTRRRRREVHPTHRLDKSDRRSSSSYPL